jgi:hypothetical protein
VLGRAGRILAAGRIGLLRLCSEKEFSEIATKKKVSDKEIITLIRVIGILLHSILRWWVLRA